MFDIDRPPFAVTNGAPDQVANVISDLYRSFGVSPPTIKDVWCAASRAIGLSQHEPLCRAGLNLAHSLDRGDGAGITNGYHNRTHFIEVLLNSVYLLQRNQNHSSSLHRLTLEDKASVMFAALGHDIYYEVIGLEAQKSSLTPYQLEWQSINHLKPFLNTSVISEPKQTEITVMILGTDVSPITSAGSYVRAAHRYHFEWGVCPITTEVLEPLRALLSSSRLSHMAALLSDSDILCSAGLTEALADEMDEKLALERRTALSFEGRWRSRLEFLKTIVENRFTTEEARFFQPNLDRMRLSLEQRIRGTGTGTGTREPPDPR